MSVVFKILKWILIIVLLLGLLGWGLVKYMSEDRPENVINENGDQLANQMLASLNKPAWDSLKYLTWDFKGGHNYVWDKQNNNVKVSWAGNEALIDLDEVDGIAKSDGVLLEGDEAKRIINQGWGFWCNDSFWMFAPFKVFDPGTKRSIVKDENGDEGLMVTYESGGVTPGDSYLWFLDDNKIPTRYKMWTFVPIQGMEMSWENWKTLKGGAKVAISHNSSILSFDMEGVKEGNSLEELGLDSNLFAALKG